MNEIYTIDEIAAAVAPVSERYGIESIVLFGSYARGEATAKSDIDLLISYKRLTGAFALGGVYAELEEVLGKPVDVVSEKALTADYADKHARELLDAIRREGVVIYRRG